MEEEIDSPLDGVIGKRSCEPCRMRKIRCDRKVPCSNCRASKATCMTVAPAKKIHRQRVHISGEYEKKIDRLEDRLTSIESVLVNLSSKLEGIHDQNNSNENINHPRSQSSRLTAEKSVAETETLTPVPFEGETGNNRQSDYLRELLVKKAEETPEVAHNTEVKTALAALGELVAQHDRDTVSTTSASQPLIDRSLANINTARLAKPPWDVVGVAIDRAKSYPTMTFAALFSILKMKNLYEIVEDAYFSPATCGAPRRLLAYGVLFNIFTEFSSAPWSGIDKRTLAYYASLAKTQLDVAMSQLDSFAPASYENIMALSLGTACAVEMCKPSLAWVFVSNAAGMCQNLGYHRFNTMKNDSEEERRSKMHLFWMIYMFDKQLSLRLGRASLIQDWDISLPRLTASPSPNGFEGSDMLLYWVKVAKTQGQIYEKLFSPAAFLRTPEERAQTAKFLIGAMNHAWRNRGQASIMDYTNLLSPNETELPSKRKRSTYGQGQDALKPDTYMQAFDKVEDVFFHTDVVVHYSTCALIQKAISPDNNTFNQECLEYSRAALVAHMRCSAQFNTKASTELWSGYIHWSLLQAPLTPFIVLFGNAIQQADCTDLQSLTDFKSLTDFVTSLESSRTISEGAEKLYNMCLLFLKVARIYMQAKSQEQRSSHTQSFSHAAWNNFYSTADGSPVDFSTIAQFDPHLSALGLVSNPAWSMADYASGMLAPGNVTGAQEQSAYSAQGLDSPELGYDTLNAGHNPVQDWFSGSRFLYNVMDTGSDLPMPDTSDRNFQ